jgi:hypothetical protein
MTYKEIIFDIQTGETTERPYTKKEIDAIKAAEAQTASEQAALALKAAEKASLLNRLGLTEDELKTILG